MEIFTLLMFSNLAVLLVDDGIKKKYLYKIMHICHSVAAVHS